ncbi:MAG: hypothetical protein IT236_13505 [Bacteroidia bacterium]|nr:hypothetical protein [Bacteroidia bacterium]
MLKYFGIILFAVMGITACAKDRECECKNSNGTYPAGTTKATKQAAKKHCESLSGGDTKCYLK